MLLGIRQNERDRVVCQLSSMQPCAVVSMRPTIGGRVKMVPVLRSASLKSGHVRIERAEALAYRVPLNLRGKDSTRTVAPLNYLVRLNARSSQGNEYSGVGEAQPRVGLTGDIHRESWSFLDRALKNLIGTEIPLNDPLEAVRGVIESCERLADWDEVNLVFRSRATIMGIETALLDVVARSLRISLADLLGRRRAISPSMPPIVRSRELPEIESALQSLRGLHRNPLRLVGVGDPDADLIHMMQVSEARKAVSARAGSNPLWVQFSEKLELPDARRFIDKIIGASAVGSLPAEIILQAPLSADLRDQTVDLQAYANQRCSQESPRTEITVLHRASDPAMLAELFATADQQHTRVPLLHLRPGQLGGILRTLDVAESLARRDPSAGVLLSQFAGASGITHAAHRQLALALHGVRYVSGAADVNRKFKVSQRNSRGRFLLRRGLGMELRYQSLVSKAQDRIVHPHSSSSTYRGLEPNTFDDVDFIRPIGPYAVHGHIVEREALARGLESWRFTKSSFAASDGHGEMLPFRRSRWPLSGPTAAAVAKHKEATRILLKAADCPVPEGRTFAGGDHQGALGYADRIGYPVVVKPAEGSMGIGVVANIHHEAELRTALDMLSRTTYSEDEFIVEKHIRGADYRIMVIGQEVVAAVKRVPASVTGDGVQTVGQLIVQKNIERQRNTHLGQLRLKWDEASRHALKKSGYGFDSVLPRGVHVELSSTSNLTQGGDSIEILEELHPSISEAAVKAVAAVPGMGYCGVDFLLEDHTQPLTSQDGAICELNVMAALPVAEYPVYGQPRRLSERFIGECADAFGLEISQERAESLNLSLTVHGHVSGVGYRKWFAQRARASGLNGWVRQVDERKMEARISGPLAPAAALVTAAILGPPRALPDMVHTRHVNDGVEEGFWLPDFEETTGTLQAEHELRDTLRLGGEDADTSETSYATPEYVDDEDEVLT